MASLEYKEKDIESRKKKVEEYDGFMAKEIKKGMRGAIAAEKKVLTVLRSKQPEVKDSIAGVPDDDVERTRNRKRQALRYRRSGRVGTMLSQGSGLG